VVRGIGPDGRGYIAIAFLDCQKSTDPTGELYSERTSSLALAAAECVLEMGDIGRPLKSRIVLAFRQLTPLADWHLSLRRPMMKDFAQGWRGPAQRDRVG
jgi:hypothetical protein